MYEIELKKHKNFNDEDYRYFSHIQKSIQYKDPSAVFLLDNINNKFIIKFNSKSLFYVFLNVPSIYEFTQNIDL